MASIQRLLFSVIFRCGLVLGLMVHKLSLDPLTDCPETRLTVTEITTDPVSLLFCFDWQK